MFYVPNYVLSLTIAMNMIEQYLLFSFIGLFKFYLFVLHFLAKFLCSFSFLFVLAVWPQFFCFWQDVKRKAQILLLNSIQNFVDSFRLENCTELLRKLIFWDQSMTALMADNNANFNMMKCLTFFLYRSIFNKNSLKKPQGPTENWDYNLWDFSVSINRVPIE